MSEKELELDANADVLAMSRQELFEEAKRLEVAAAGNLKNTDLQALIIEARKNAVPPTDPAPEASVTVPETPAASGEQPSPAATALETEDKAASVAAEPAEQPLVKGGFLKVRINNFRGTFKDALFDDDGVCERISEETMRTLANDFPGVEVVSYEELD